MSDDNERLFGLPNEPVDINWRNDLKSITADDTRQRLEAYWWHLYGMKQHRVDAECGGRVCHSYTSSETGSLVCADVTDLTIATTSMRPCIDYLARMVEDAIWLAVAGRWAGPAGSVCSVGDSKGEAGVGCQV